MRKAIGWAWIVVLLGCGEADPRDAWVGTYIGTLTREARDCTTGERLDPLASDGRVTVIALGDHLAIDGGCLVEFDLTSDTRGRIRPFTCSRALSDGTPIVTRFASGRLILDGPELYLETAADVSTPEWCETTSDVFVGLRE